MKDLFIKELPPIPTYHKKDNKFTKHCVDCGILLLKYDWESGGYNDPPEIGDLLYSLQHKRILNGYRCLKCHDKLEYYIREYYINEN